jgi:uncharacterized protein with GYD domain
MEDLGRSVARSVKLQESSARALQDISATTSELDKRALEMGASLDGLSRQSQELAAQARSGLEELAEQGAEAIKENREGFSAMSAQAEKLSNNMDELFKRTGEQLETVARGSAEASLKTAELAAQLAQAHDVQCQVLKAQQAQLELTKSIGKAVDSAFGSAAGLIAVAWYSAASVVIIVATSFSVTSGARSPALAIVVFTGLAEYAATLGQYSDLTAWVFYFVRIGGSITALATVVAVAIYKVISGTSAIDADEERFMRYVAKYIMRDRSV